MATPSTDRRGGTPATATRLSPLAVSKALFFLAAGLSFLVSVYLFFNGDREQGIFVGIWVPSILSAGGLLLSGARHE